MSQGGSPLLPLFVYGLLRPGQSGFVELGLAGRVQCMGAARVRGRMFDLGDYPGVVLGGPDWVVGELLRPLDAGLMPLLDEYECYDPARPDQSEYRRVETVSETGLTVCIYVYNRHLAGAVLLPSGDWIQHRQTLE